LKYFRTHFDFIAGNIRKEADVPILIENHVNSDNITRGENVVVGIECTKREKSRSTDVWNMEDKADRITCSVVTEQHDLEDHKNK